jgi:large subunit ribosomal protein L30
MAKLKITYAKSTIGFSKDQKATVASLGLRKLNSFAIHPDTATVRGMIWKVKHLVRVEEVGDDEATVSFARNTQNHTRPTIVRAAPVTSAGETLTMSAADDLTIIEGIGPKIAGVLAGEGIVTFQQLAEMRPEAINALLAGKIRIASTDSWPEQAQLAADGKMDELKALQDQLTAGRRD